MNQYVHSLARVTVSISNSNAWNSLLPNNILGVILSIIKTCIHDSTRF